MKEGLKSDVVITWPRDEKRLKQIQKSGRCPSYGKPLEAKENAWVALADKYGYVLLLFQLKRIEPHENIIGANRKRYPKGWVLVAKPGTMRRRFERPCDVNVKPYPGAIGYFDYQTWKRVNYGTGPGGQPPPPPPRPPRTPFLANNLGKEIGKPEADLVNRFVNWLDNHRHFEKHFEHRRLASATLFTDLFIKGHNILVEAKAYSDRKSIRMAIGQLFDYREYFRRPPRLALLVPERLSKPILNLLITLHIACIWETKSGSFNDSKNGAYTRNLRQEYRSRNRKSRRK